MSAVSFLPATARAAALSDRLLASGEVERMLAAPSVDEAFKILYDLRWAQVAADANDTGYFEQVIDAGLYDVKQLIRSASPRAELPQFILYWHDLLNAKATLAATQAGKKYEDIREDLSDLSYFPKRIAFDILETGATPEPVAAQFMYPALIEAKGILEKHPDRMSDAETLLDSAFFVALYRLTVKLASPAISRFFDRMVEAENIKKRVRIGNDAKVTMVAPRLGNAGIAINDWEDGMRASTLKPFLDEGLALAAENRSLADWEIALDMNVLQSLFWAAKANPFGPAGLVLYFFTKERNAEIIRTILVGKQNGIATESIRKMIDPYFTSLRHS